MKTVKDIFYFVEDVMIITGLSRSKSYKIIADLNRELSDRGYCVIPGRIAKSYFHERYCYTQEVAAKAAAPALPTPQARNWESGCTSSSSPTAPVWGIPLSTAASART